MVVRLGQLIYTSFAIVGFRTLASVQVPDEIQRAFIQQIVHQYWDSYNPPAAGYRAAYLHQISPMQTLFGWLFNDGADDLGRVHVPYFICYILTGRLYPDQLNRIWACLEAGPATFVDRQNYWEAIDSVFLPESWSYQPVCAGVTIPADIREQGYMALDRGELLRLFVPSEETDAATGYSSFLENLTPPELLMSITGGSGAGTQSLVEQASPEWVGKNHRHGAQSLRSAILAQQIGHYCTDDYRQLLTAKAWVDKPPVPHQTVNFPTKRLPLNLRIAASVLSLLTLVGGGFYLLQSSVSPSIPSTHTPSSPTPPTRSSPLALPDSSSIPYSSYFSTAKTLTRHSDAVWSVALSADGQILASGGEDGTIKIWTVATGEVLHTRVGHADVVRTLAISPDGRSLVSGSDDNTLKRWDLQTGELLQTLCEDVSSIRSVAISPNGQILVSAEDAGVVRIWHLATGEPLQTIQAHADRISSTAISPDGQTLATASLDKTIKLWNLRTGELIRTLDHHTDAVLSIAFSPDGQQLVSGSRDETVKLWNWSTGVLRHTLKGHTGSVLTVAFNADGQTLLSGGMDSTIKIWDTQTGQPLRSLSGHGDWVLAIATSPEQFASSSKDKTIQIWQR